VFPAARPIPPGVMPDEWLSSRWAAILCSLPSPSNSAKPRIVNLYALRGQSSQAATALIAYLHGLPAGRYLTCKGPHLDEQPQVHTLAPAQQAKLRHACRPFNSAS
jgi:hypothetical protein